MSTVTTSIVMTTTATTSIATAVTTTATTVSSSGQATNIRPDSFIPTSRFLFCPGKSVDEMHRKHSGSTKCFTPLVFARGVKQEWLYLLLPSPIIKRGTALE